MIVSNTRNKSKIDARKMRIAIIAISVLALAYYVYHNFTFFTGEAKEGTYFCDMENVNGAQFVSQGRYFDNAKTRTDEKAYSGKYSSKLNTGSQFQYGVGMILEEYKEGDSYRLSVRRFNEAGTKGFIAVSGEGKENFYKESYLPVEKSKDGWELLQLDFTIPYHKELENIKLFVYSFGKGVMYFDDFKLEKLEQIEEKVYEHPSIALQIKDKYYRQLERKRDNALNIGMLETEDGDWVKAKLLSDEEKEAVPIEMRLKGDWLDHLKGKKWSFRVKVKDPYAWNRLKVFSLHTPAARGFLDEWVLHKFWEREGVLTPRYDFVELSLNNQALGTYAYEEHFVKQLAESKNRREGPILKFSEDGFWKGMKRQLDQLGAIDHTLKQTVKWKETAQVEPFAENKTLSNPSLAKQYEIAKNLMYQYMHDLKPSSEIFDLELMAKHYAICDVMKAYHGTAWHNQRFYYNPITTRLEPIGFDGFPSDKLYHQDFLGQGAMNPTSYGSWILYGKLFLEEAFVEKYIHYLYKYSDKNYIENFIYEVIEDAEKRTGFIKKEFPDYDFQIMDLVEKAQRVNVLILPYNDLSLKAHLQKKEADKMYLKVANTHGLPIKLVGYGLKKEKIDQALDSTLTLGSYQTKGVIDYQDLIINGNANYLFFKLVGIDSLFHSRINRWKVPSNEVPAQTLTFSQDLSSNDLYAVQDSIIIFRVGKHTISKDILIPEGRLVKFGPGVELDMIKNAKFISKSPIIIDGSIDQPVKVYSSDQTAKGFSVLQAKGKSLVRNAIFENLNTLIYQGWQLTGAVNFYESDVDIYKTIIRKNHCEDALNIVRSEFRMEYTTITDTKFDGFDADFCGGVIKHSKFYRTGNDCLDFSGCKVIIENCDLRECGDKGISVGEETKATVRSATIDKAIIGVASKDLSALKVKDITLKNCNQGFTAYQKKAEFGGSSIIVEHYIAENVNRLYNIRAGCTLDLMGKEISN